MPCSSARSSADRHECQGRKLMKKYRSYTVALSALLLLSLIGTPQVQSAPPVQIPQSRLATTGHLASSSPEALPRSATPGGCLRSGGAEQEQGCAECLQPAIAAAAPADRVPALGNPGLRQERPGITTSSLPYTTFIQATNGVPATLDPALDYEGCGGNVLGQVYEPLLFFNREDVTALVPMLATEWSISPDGRAYTFHIRQGVHFHNGDMLTPSDVAYSFQRGLLQGGSDSPQWLLAEPFLGSNLHDIVELIDPALVDNREALKLVAPAVLQKTCQVVTNAIVADDENWVVTMTLAHPWQPFLATLAQPWGSVMDQEWVVQNGGWDGSCMTWQDYYAMQPGEDPFSLLVNGTGPFTLEWWSTDGNISLVRNPGYWRTEPMWESGPSGPAALERAVIWNVITETTRYEMLANGDVDTALLSSTYFDQLDDQVLFHYTEQNGLVGALEHPTGTLKLYSGGLGINATDAFFSYNIATGGPRNYVGSGTLDGSGIPVDFFTDIHVRKAFNYSFDWTTYISDVYGGGAIQRRGPIVAGLLGYTDTQPTYFYSPTLALQEFSQAWSGQLIANGFAMTLTYSEGNLPGQLLYSILKNNIEALDPNFHVNVVELTPSNYAADRWAFRLPIFVTGWLQDIPHPHNWVDPYLVGTFSSQQRLPSAMRDVYQAKIDACVALIGDAARSCYEDIQNTAYLDAVDIFLAQSYERQYLRAQVRGYYDNEALYGPYFYALSKGPLPVVRIVTPGIDQSIGFSSTNGSTGTLLLPAGSVTQTMAIAITPDTIATGEPIGYHLGKLTFDVEAYVEGTLLPELTFENPVTLTLHYSPAARGSLIEEDLLLFSRNGNAWEDAACGPYLREAMKDCLQVPVCHLSQFALGGLAHEISLPVILR